MKAPRVCPFPGCPFSLHLTQFLLCTASSPFPPFSRHASLPGEKLRLYRHASSRASTNQVRATRMLCFVLIMFILISHSPTSALDLSAGALAQRDIPDSITDDTIVYDDDEVDEETWSSLAARSTTASNDSFTMPVPFDTNMQSNSLTSNCHQFFSDFLSNPDFTNCHAVSMLLENSNSFFHSLTSAAKISAILDTSCAASLSRCSTITTDLAIKLLKDDACGPDYQNNNPLVMTAYTDMITYQPIYNTSCLMNQETGNYCFVDAVMNASNPDDYSVYFLPLGTYYTDASSPSCSQCLQATMAVFAQWAEVKQQPLVNTYLPSAHRLNQVCGANFADANVTVGVKNAVTSISGRSRPYWSLLIYALMLALAVWGLEIF